MEDLGESGRGEHGYGSTGVSAGKTNENQAINTNDEGSSQRLVSVQAVETNLIDKVAKRQSHLSEARRIISARQIQKLAKEDNHIFLDIIRSTYDAPQIRGKKGNKKFPHRAARFAAHGLMEGQKRLMNRKTGPKKDIITVKEREQQVLDNAPQVFRKDLVKHIKEY